MGTLVCCSNASHTIHLVWVICLREMCENLLFVVVMPVILVAVVATKVEVVLSELPVFDSCIVFFSIVSQQIKTLLTEHIKKVN